MAETTASSDKPIVRTLERPKVSHRAFMKEFRLPDGRPIMIDKRAIAFICADRSAPELQTIIAFRAGAAKPCPVIGAYAAVKAWWFGSATTTPPPPF